MILVASNRAQRESQIIYLSPKISFIPKFYGLSLNFIFYHQNLSIVQQSVSNSKPVFSWRQFTPLNWPDSDLTLTLTLLKSESESVSEYLTQLKVRVRSV